MLHTEFGPKLYILPYCKYAAPKALLVSWWNCRNESNAPLTSDHCRYAFYSKLCPSGTSTNVHSSSSSRPVSAELFVCEMSQRCSCRHGSPTKTQSRPCHRTATPSNPKAMEMICQPWLNGIDKERHQMTNPGVNRK